MAQSLEVIDMADEKISDMPAATQFFSSDIFPIVQSGMNLSVRRDIFMRWNAGEDLLIVGPAGSLGISAAGVAQFYAATNIQIECLNPLGIQIESQFCGVYVQPNTIQINVSSSGTISIQNNGPVIAKISPAGFEVDVTAGHSIIFRSATAIVFGVSNNGGITYTTRPGQPFTCNANGGQIQLDSSGGVFLFAGNGVSCFVEYDALNPSYWAGSPPADLADAIERIAARVSLGGSSPIP